MCFDQLKTKHSIGIQVVYYIGNFSTNTTFNCHTLNNISLSHIVYFSFTTFVQCKLFSPIFFSSVNCAEYVYKFEKENPLNWCIILIIIIIFEIKCLMYTTRMYKRVEKIIIYRGQTTTPPPHLCATSRTHVYTVRT